MEEDDGRKEGPKFSQKEGRLGIVLHSAMRRLQMVTMMRKGCRVGKAVDRQERKPTGGFQSGG